MNEQCKLLTAHEVADLFAVSRSTVLQWHRLGELPSVKLGRTVRFVESDVQAVIDARLASMRRHPAGGAL